MLPDALPETARPAYLQSLARGPHWEVGKSTEQSKHEVMGGLFRKVLELDEAGTIWFGTSPPLPDPSHRSRWLTKHTHCPLAWTQGSPEGPRDGHCLLHISCCRHGG